MQRTSIRILHAIRRNRTRVGVPNLTHWDPDPWVPDRISSKPPIKMDATPMCPSPVGYRQLKDWYFSSLRPKLLEQHEGEWIVTIAGNPNEHHISKTFSEARQHLPRSSERNFFLEQIGREAESIDHYF